MKEHGSPLSLLKAFNSYSIWTQVWWLWVNDNKTQVNTPEGTQERTADSTSVWACAGRCGRGANTAWWRERKTPLEERRSTSALAPCSVYTRHRQRALFKQARNEVTFSWYDWRGKNPQVFVWKTHKCSFCLLKQKATYNLWTHLSRDSSEDNLALSRTGPPRAPGVCTAMLPRTERSFRLNQKHFSKNALQSLLSLPPV